MDAQRDAARRAAEDAARRSYGKLLALLSWRTRDVAGAEDALAEAFAAALARWPATGVPDDPEAWLMTTARRRRTDQHRRQRTRLHGQEHLAMIADELEDAAAAKHEIPDERLRLLFVCAHPAIDPGVRAPLMLQTILGFDAAEIAAAFLVSPAAMAQRLVRAKQRIRLTGIPFAVPEPHQLAERLAPVLAAIYAAYAEGWTDPAAGDVRRRNLAEEGIWLGRLLVGLLPDEPEVLGLMALMLYAEARRAARRDQAGDYVPLDRQDTALWDSAMLGEADALLSRAGTMGRMGRYQLEAAVQAAHAARRHGGEADWTSIRRFYDALVRMTGSPVAHVNLAMALAEIDGAEAGLTALDVAASDGRLAGYQPYWAARATLTERLGRTVEAAEAYARAIGLERDPAVRRYLMDRAAGLTDLVRAVIQKRSQ